jgi:hypothetical protein
MATDGTCDELDPAIEAWIYEWELDPETRRRYDLSVGKFRAWCAEDGLDPSDVTSLEVTVATWVGWRIRPESTDAGVGTLELDLAALRHHYVNLGIDDPTGLALWVVAGHARTRPTQRRIVTPLTPALIERICARPAPRTPAGAALKAATLVSRAGRVDFGVLLDTPVDGVAASGDGLRIRVPSGVGGPRGRTRIGATTIELARHPDTTLCPVTAVLAVLDAEPGPELFAALHGEDRREDRGLARRQLTRTAAGAGVEVTQYPHLDADDDLRRILLRLDPPALTHLLARAYLLVGAAGPLTGAELRDLQVTDLALVEDVWHLLVARGVRGRVLVPIPPSPDLRVCPAAAIDAWLLARGTSPGPLLCRTRDSTVLYDRPIQVQAGTKLLRALVADLADGITTSSMELGFLHSQVGTEETPGRIAASLPPHRLETIEARLRSLTIHDRPATRTLGGLL